MINSYDNNDNLVSFLSNSDIEFGSNSNGSYLKFSNGLLICYGQSKRLANSSGSKITITYPIEFKNNPVVVASPVYNHDEEVYITIGSVTTKNAGAYCNGVNYGFSKDQAVYYIAIGR